jgi:hypothetical protein
MGAQARPYVGMTNRRTERTDRTRFERALLCLLLVPEVMLIAGGYGAAFGSRVAAFAMLGGFVTLVLIHHALGVRLYRSAMNHPWPKVKAINEWDE